jgi:hypothetical protein
MCAYESFVMLNATQIHFAVSPVFTTIALAPIAYAARFSPDIKTVPDLLDFAPAKGHDDNTDERTETAILSAVTLSTLMVRSDNLDFSRKPRSV